MKKLLLVVMVTVLGMGTICAQHIAKGTKMINVQATNLGFNSVSYSFDGTDADESMSRFGIGAGAGYAFMDDIMLIGALTLQSLKIDETKMTAFSIGASGRKYFQSGLFAGAGLNVMSGSIDVYEDKMSTTLIDGIFHAGIAIEVLPQLTLEPIVTFSTKLAGGSVDGYDHKLTYTQFSVNIGFSYYF